MGELAAVEVTAGVGFAVLGEIAVGDFSAACKFVEGGNGMEVTPWVLVVALLESEKGSGVTEAADVSFLRGLLVNAPSGS